MKLFPGRPLEEVVLGRRKGTASIMNKSEQPATLDDFPLVITLPVQWGDQDAFGHVNNTVHIRWFESARLAYFERIGFSAKLVEHGVGPILASITCHYRRQVNYPDTVDIGARIARIGNSSMTMEHRAVSRTQQAMVADGDSVIVVFNYDKQAPIRVPEDTRAAIETLQGKAPGS